MSYLQQETIWSPKHNDLSTGKLKKLFYAQLNSYSAKIIFNMTTPIKCFFSKLFTEIPVNVNL